jgi:hypothetical protein
MSAVTGETEQSVWANLELVEALILSTHEQQRFLLVEDGEAGAAHRVARAAQQAKTLRQIEQDIAGFEEVVHLRQ